jgi:hypothetical protein
MAFSSVVRRSSRELPGQLISLAFTLTFWVASAELPSFLPDSADRALKLLESKKIPFLLLTNGGGAVTESERIKLLSHELQIDLAPTQLVQSHTPFVSPIGLEPCSG